MKGRKPLPNGVKALRGQSGSGIAITEIPICPRTLSAESKKIWKSVVPLLSRYQIATQADVSALSVLCDLLSTIDKCNQDLNTRGLVLMTPSGHEVPNKFWRIKLAAQTQLIRLLTEFGLTPVSRARIAAEPEQTKDELEAFLNGNE